VHCIALCVLPCYARDAILFILFNFIFIARFYFIFIPLAATAM
jgi:hypothetical protein